MKIMISTPRGILKPYLSFSDSLNYMKLYQKFGTLDFMFSPFDTKQQTYGIKNLHKIRIKLYTVPNRKPVGCDYEFIQGCVTHSHTLV